MNAIAWLNPGRWLLVAGAIAAALLGWKVLEHNLVEGGREQGRLEVQRRWDAEKIRQGDQALALARSNAEETARRLAEQQELQHAHDLEISRARADRDRAAAAAGSLRGQLAAFVAAVARPAAGDPAAAGERQAAGSAVDLLADLFGRADARAGELAAALDESRAAGLQCERSYDALSSRSSP